MPQGRTFMCHSCGKTVEFLPDQRPCEVLSDWVMVSRWKGVGTVEHHHFCCLACLQTWVNKQSPTVPEVFLRAFEDDSAGQE